MGIFDIKTAILNKHLPAPDSTGYIHFLRSPNFLDEQFVSGLYGLPYDVLEHDSFMDFHSTVSENTLAFLIITEGVFRRFTDHESLLLHTAISEGGLIALLLVDDINDAQLINRAQKLCVFDIISSNHPLAFNTDKLSNLVALHSQRILTRSYELQLTKTKKQLEEYVYIVSHDFKAPLRGLASLTQFIVEELGKGQMSDEVNELMIMMKSRTDFIQRMVDDLLLYSRMTTRSAEPEPVSVKTLINNIIDDLPMPESTRIEYPDSPPPLVTEKLKLREVILQLIKNGVAFNDSSLKTIRLSCRDLGNFVEFQITDNGRGMKTEHIEKAFGLFQKLQSKDKQDGTGIGLTLVKGIVEQQGGAVRIESVVSKGTSVFFTWPK